MATIDSNIAMGYKPVQIENPLNQLAAMTQIQAGQQGQQLNALKLQEAQLELEDRNKLRGLDINSPDFISNVSKFNPKLALTLQKDLAAYKKSGLETTELQGKISKQEMDRNNQNLRNLSRNPSNANIQAYFEDFVLDNPNEAQKIANAQRTRDYLLSADIPTRNAYLSSIGATAGELKPVIKDTDIGGSILPRVLDPYSGLPISTGKPIAKTATPGESMTNAIARERLAADLNPDIQAKLAASKAAGTTTGKAQAAAAIALPNAIATSESLLGKIDAMVGTPAVKDKNGKVINAGTAPHPGFTGAVGMGRGATLGIPGVEQLIPGTPAADFKARFDEIMGGAFLEAFETLKGGGAITETEGKKATAAKTRMNLAQSEKEFLTAAREYKDIVKTGIERARKKAGEAPSGGVDIDALLKKYE